MSPLPTRGLRRHGLYPTWQCALMTRVGADVDAGVAPVSDAVAQRMEVGGDVARAA